MAFDEPTTETAPPSELKLAEVPVGVAKSEHGKPKWKWLKRSLLGVVIVILVGWVVGALLLRSWTAKPPQIPANASILQSKL